MAYVAVKGGTEAIEASLNRLQVEKLSSEHIMEVETIMATMKSLIDQVMSESSLYNRYLAALAIKQAEGSMEEAVFLLRAHRSTMPRLYTSMIVETENMFVERRISASFKDIIGGQVLGATPDYAHRLIDFSLANDSIEMNREKIAKYTADMETEKESEEIIHFPKVVETLRTEGLFPVYEKNNEDPYDITKETVKFPMDRSARLQMLTRGMTSAVTALGYASLRGYGAVHPTVGELRYGQVPIHIQTKQSEHAEDAHYIGEIPITEVESFVPISIEGEDGKEDLEFEIGYGACFGKNETKTIAMSILDQCLEHPDRPFPTHDEEFVLLHIDAVESTGFISHLKLPHYVTFQSKLDAVRNVKKERSTNDAE